MTDETAIVPLEEGEEKEQFDLFDGLRKALDEKIDTNAIKQDMFYDICSDSGWSRDEVDEMCVAPGDIELDEWTIDDLMKFMCKWLTKITKYFVEVKKEEDGTYTFNFYNAISTRLMGYVPVTQRAKDLKDAVDGDHHTIKPPDPYDKTLTWAQEAIIKISEEVPRMTVPKLDSPLLAG